LVFCLHLPKRRNAVLYVSDLGIIISMIGLIRGATVFMSSTSHAKHPFPLLHGEETRFEHGIPRICDLFLAITPRGKQDRSFLSANLFNQV
jgi:hypothetical protein